jgi:hypothetical protein
MDWEAASTAELQLEISELEAAIAAITLEAEHFEATRLGQEGYRLNQQLAKSRRDAIQRKRPLLEKLRAILTARQS